MNKINIFFDSKIFLDEFFNVNSGRSGVFFVAWNVLQIMQKNKTFHITLVYTNEYEGSGKIKKIKKAPFFSQFKFVNIETAIKQKIKEHKTNKNYIKIFYNYLHLVKYKIKGKELKDKEIFKNTQIYLSPYFAIPKSFLMQDHIKKYYILYDLIPFILPEYRKYADSVHIPIINTLNKDIYSFCISQSCKDDYLKYYGDKLEANKMFVTHIATNQQYIPKYNKQKLIKVLKKYGIKHNPDDKYLFSLCTLEPRKNLPFTISCFCKFIKKHNIHDLYFYLGGGAYTSFMSTIKKVIEEAGDFGHKIKLLGYINDIDMNILYSNSLFFTFLSQYEGFGMPPLEAMQAGTPVITSNNSSLPEVVGDAAISLTYNDEEGIIKAFEDFYFNDNLRKEYIAKGLERAKMFSWEKSVGKMIEIIEDVAKVNTIVDTRIDVESILYRIRRDINEKRIFKDKLSFEDNFDNVFLSLIPKDNDFVDIEQHLDILRNSWDIQPNKSLNGNPLIILIKKIIRKLIRFFILPIINEQNAINYSVFCILEKNCEMKVEIERLNEQIVQLEERVKNIPVDCNQELFFKKNSFATNYLGKGFSDPENNFTWTNQETAEINIPILFKNTDLIIIIRGKLLTPSQTVEVIINNRTYGEIKNFNSKYIIKDKELLNQNNLNIKFLISKPYSPKELGINDDSRTLGFALTAISLSMERS